MQVKQNKCIRSIFFARNREGPHVYYKLLEILKLKNIFNLKICILVYRIKYIKTKIPSVFLDFIPSVSEIHCYDTKYSGNHNLYRPSSRANYGLSRFKVISSRIWEKIPLNIKQLSFNRFKSFIFFSTKIDLLCIYILSRFKVISSRVWEKIPLNIKQLSFNRFKSFIFFSTKIDLLCIYIK